jgi:hypothetical protein
VIWCYSCKKFLCFKIFEKERLEKEYSSRDLLYAMKEDFEKNSNPC